MMIYLSIDVYYFGDRNGKKVPRIKNSNERQTFNIIEYLCAVHK